jgi:hypothetical protein
MAQIHYVVVYDTEQKEFYPDVDTEISRFPDGSVFIDEEGWKHSGDTEFEDEAYHRWIQLKEILREFNQSVEAGE